LLCLKRCTLIFLLILLGCSHKKKIEVQRSFYYRKSVFHLSPGEQAALDFFSIHKLYVRFFDVDWSRSARTALPVSKIQKEIVFYPDPFYDYVNDNQRYDKKSSVPYTKLGLAQKLSDLQKSIAATTDKEAKSKLYYRLATALYNMSFYGNSWQAVDYYRHTSQWNTGVYKAPWEKEYYGVHTARAYYQKAYDLTSNKEFKAACYFLIIKCTQRQIAAPGRLYLLRPGYKYGY